MSYCAFENTASAIRQLLGIVEDCYDVGMTFSELVESRSSEYESRAVVEIVELAQQLVDSLNDLDHDVVEVEVELTQELIDSL
jgi:uncharacterized protein YfbU (UPF0304 family)